MLNDKKTAKKAKIADAAYALMAERGYAGTSMLAIAKAAKASNETLYNWYGDKTGMFRELVAMNADDIATKLDAVASGPSPLTTLEHIGADLLAMLLGPRAIALNQAAAADPTGALGAEIAAGGRDRIAPLIAHVIDQAIRTGDLAGPTLQITETFLALLISDSQIRRAIGTLPAPDAATCAMRAAQATAQLRRLYPA